MNLYNLKGFKNVDLADKANRREIRLSSGVIWLEFKFAPSTNYSSST
jgi:hypothetical protein